MLFGFPWWAWLLVFVVFWVLPSIARRHFQDTVRRELVAYIRAEHPEVVITSHTFDALHLRSGETTAQLNLANVYKAVAAVRPPTDAARREVFARFCAPLGSMEQDLMVSRETHGDRILPRLVDETFLNALPDRKSLPVRPLGFTGLSVTYVLDSPQHVAYLTRDQSEELKLDDRELHELALANLRARTDAAAFEPARAALTVLQNPDGHDPARLLLLPALLGENETLAAVIAARDVLILAPAPTDGNWTTWHALLNGDDSIGDRALKVSTHGIEAAPLAVD